MFRMFNGCTSLKSLDLSNFNTEKITDMSSMFYGCISLESVNLSNFNTAECKDFGGMFFYCRTLTSVDVSHFDTSNAINNGYYNGMLYMFINCSSLKELDCSNFIINPNSSVKLMFAGCTALTKLNISSFDTNTVIVDDIFEGAFDGATGATLILGEKCDASSDGQIKLQNGETPYETGIAYATKDGYTYTIKSHSLMRGARRIIHTELNDVKGTEPTPKPLPADYYDKIKIPVKKNSDRKIVLMELLK